MEASRDHELVDLDRVEKNVEKDNPTSAPPPTPMRKKDFGFIPIPRHRRHDTSLKPEEQFAFTWRMNIIFALAATVTVANLYYIQPMLVAIARDLGVTNERVSNLPTLLQGGYGVGILFISPLGDMIRRRQLVLLLVTMTTLLNIGLALTPNVQAMEGLCFVTGFFTVTPQMCIPWTADLAPSTKRARSMSITMSGLILGLCMGRVLAGVITEETTWRNVYWFAVGVQGAMLFVLYFTLPDTPGKDLGLTYPQILWSMVRLLTKHPTLVQACLIAFSANAVFAGLQVSLTFLLSDEPYSYNPLTIGLFGLAGLSGVILAPQIGRVVDKIVPWCAQLSGIVINICAMTIALTAAKRSVAVVVIVILIYDFGQSMLQISSSYRIAGIDPSARARLNSCFLLSLFVGQTSGTAIMTKIYNTKGWTPTAGTAVAFLGFALVVLCSRGPFEKRWLGWRGGYGWRRKEVITDTTPHAVTE